MAIAQKTIIAFHALYSLFIDRLKVHGVPEHKKQLPRELTSYDFLKAFALITMVIDHTGYYFFPEQRGLN